MASSPTSAFPECHIALVLIASVFMEENKLKISNYSWGYIPTKRGSHLLYINIWGCGKFQKPKSESKTTTLLVFNSTLRVFSFVMTKSRGYVSSDDH